LTSRDDVPRVRVTRSCFYAWLHTPLSERAIEDQRLLRLIRASYAASHGVYGSPRVFLDLREAGESRGKHRVARIMRADKINALRGYKAPRMIAGRPSIIAPNKLQREFSVKQPNRVWVTDVTYIRTWQGWLYLAAVIDLYARNIVGWSNGLLCTSQQQERKRRSPRLARKSLNQCRYDHLVCNVFGHFRMFGHILFNRI
jgi:transposase InsO family protein